MRLIEFTSQFKRDLKRAKRDPRKDTEKLQKVVETLQEQGSLSSEYRPHPLSGQWIPAWECHVQPDFLLIYRITDEFVYLIRCGSHSDLF
ncbi:MAG TPA: type II toxin-antitoxin system YafQ family toxin [Thiolinea sp.]|nr:type II toxin-antitoxin system YafQ family toxin [Thiolinea sp.]